MSDWTEQKIDAMIKNKVEDGPSLDWKCSDALLEMPCASPKLQTPWTFQVIADDTPVPVAA